MGIGEPKMPTPAEMAEFEKKRTLSDAELIKGGAEIEVDEKGNRTNLIVTEKQIRDNMSEEQIENIENKEKQAKIELINKSIEDQGIVRGDLIRILGNKALWHGRFLEVNGNDLILEERGGGRSGRIFNSTIPMKGIEEVKLIEKSKL